MKELNDILQAYLQHAASGANMALATVVRVQGSAYRRPGARMLITGDGHCVGGVSGGCLERDVIRRAGAVMLGDRPVLVRYDTTLDAESGSGFSLGCGGAIDILIERIGHTGLAAEAASPVELMKALESSQSRRLVIVTAVTKRHPTIALGQRMMIDESSQMIGRIGNSAFSSAIVEDARNVLDAGQSEFLQYPTSDGLVDIFFELPEPPLDLVIFGAGSDAVPLVEFGKALGWKVTVVDLRSAPLDPDRVWAADEVIRCAVEQAHSYVDISESTAAVVMTHNFAHDSQLIRWLSEEPLRYLGLLGPRHRTAQVLAGLAVDAIHSPVGLDIGADNPQEVALSIVAEITAVLRGRSGLSLRSTEGPIHVSSPQSRGVPPRSSLTGPTRPGSVVEEGASCPVAGS
jgi:xanthine dehydrogenase accessory factor